MENKIGMFGKGVVENGVIKFIGADGKGFIKPVSVRREPAVINQVSIIEEEVIMDKQVEALDIPEFMKDAIKKRKQEQRKVIYVNFSKEEEQEEEVVDVGDKLADFIDDAADAVKKVIKRNPVFKYFFGEEN
jgi:hypothetical protein